MPKYRSVTLSVMSVWEMQQFPEFRHPDGAHYKPQGSTQSADDSETGRPTSTSTSSTSTNKIDSLLDRNATVSCYIPSIPGIRFCLKYAIEPPHPDGQLFYFKLFMNGRHINSWGINPRTNPRGQVLRGLFEPDETPSILENSRTMLRQTGIESRPFLFTPEVRGISAANEGGLIEVRIFRSRGRKRRAPGLENFRQQKHYGINLPSAGLLNKPQDTRYYDYMLVDPKDEPYAAFLFHYRSWDSLQSLQLIPSSHPRALLKPSNSFAFLAGISSNESSWEDGETEQLDCNDVEDFQNCQEGFPQRMANISQQRSSEMTEIARDSLSHTGRHSDALAPSSESLEHRETRNRIPNSTFSVPQATLDRWTYDRPLPRLPKAKASFDHSRSPSTCPTAPSVTPSLLSWLDRDSGISSPEPVIGIAVTVPVLGSWPLPDLVAPIIESNPHSSADLSRTALSQRKQFLRPLSNPLVIPPGALFLPSSVTVQKSRKTTSRLISTQSCLIIEDSDSEENDSHDQAGGAFAVPLEAEWLSRWQDFSPIKRESN